MTADTVSARTEADATELRPEEIDGAFVPQPEESVQVHPIGGETVLVGGPHNLVHHLDPIATVIWSVFDGTWPLDEIADFLAEEFTHDRTAVFTDVLALAQQLGSKGLLAGVAPPPPAPVAITGLDVGTPLPSFRYADADGVRVSPADLRGSRSYVINWSAGCGYCVRLADSLTGLEEYITASGIQLVFLVPGEVERNAELLASKGVAGRLLVKDVAGGTDPFPGMGTPVAYLVDETGVIAEPLAYGGDEVLAQLRQLVAAPVPVPAADDHDDQDDHDEHDHDHDHEDESSVQTLESGAKPIFLMFTGSGVCAPKAGPAGAPEDWLPPRAYRAGEVYIGLRADTEETDGVLAKVLGPIRDETLEPPSNYSVVLESADGQATGAVRGLNMLIRGSDVLIRSRSQARVVHGLLQYLSSHAIGSGDLLFTETVPAVIGDRGVLLPKSVLHRIKELQPQLTRAGIRVVDTAGGLVDIETCELVVPEPSVEHDAAALAALPDPPAKGSELARVAPGRYPLTAWYFPMKEEGPLSQASAVAHALHLSYLKGEEGELVPTLTRLFAALPAVAVGHSADPALVENIAKLEAL